MAFRSHNLLFLDYVSMRYVHALCVDRGHNPPERHALKSRSSRAANGGDELVIYRWRSEGTIAKKQLKQASLQSNLGSGSLLYGYFLVPTFHLDPRNLDSLPTASFQLALYSCYSFLDCICYAQADYPHNTLATDHSAASSQASNADPIRRLRILNRPGCLQ